jgi:hypothetical protein
MEFKAANGKYYTRQLFWDQWINLMESERIMEPPFCLHGQKPELIDFGKAYVEEEDPTGYKVSQKLLGGYKLWTVLMKTKWFQEAKKDWDEELDARLKSQGIEKLKGIMTDGMPAQQLQAAKYLANLEYKGEARSSRGRPSNFEVEKAAREAAEEQSTLAADSERIGLKLVS